MAETTTFVTAAGRTVDRQLLIACLNTGTAESPTWSPIGKRVEDSSESVEWSTETKTDIFGDTYTTAKKPQFTQTFSPCELDAGDAAQKKIWEMAIKNQDYTGLTNLDMLIVHLYVQGSTSGKYFAERYDSCAITPTGLGGEGGGSVGMPIDVVYGGKRTTGDATNTGGTITFTAAEA